MKYEKPEIELLRFETDDMVRTSDEQVVGETKTDGDDGGINSPEEW